MTILKTCVALWIIAGCVGTAVGQICAVDKPTYETLSGQLLIHNKADAARLNAVGNMDHITDQVHTYVQTLLLKELNHENNMRTVEEYVRCLQNNPTNDNWRQATNTPLLIELNPQSVVIAYWLVRGGEAVPSTKPFIDLFLRTESGWQPGDALNLDLVGTTFFIHVVNVTSRGTVLVVSGFHIGDPQTALDLDLIALESGRLRIVYKTGPLSRTTITSISPKSIVLRQEFNINNSKAPESTRRIEIPLEKLPLDKVE